MVKTLDIGDHYYHMGLAIEIIKRDGKIAMGYNGSYGYEVFKIRMHKERDVFGKSLPPGEFPPSTGQFGDKAFFFPLKMWEVANKAFDGLVMDENNS